MASKVGEKSTRTAALRGAKAENFPRPVAGENEQPSGLAFSSWAYSYDTNSISGSALTPVQGNDDEIMDDGSAVSKSRFSVPMTTSAKASTSPSAPGENIVPSSKTEDSMERVEGGPLLPGQSLDSYLLHKSTGAAEENGPEGNHDEAGRPEFVSASPEGLIGDTTGPRRWRLEVQERVCVGGVSRRLLQELEREEPKHDVEVKVAFLRKTEASEETVHRTYV